MQSLFAYLLLHRDTPVSRAQLAFRFWPDATEAGARNNLRQLLHQLRQALPGAERFLRADASSLQWVSAPPFGLDVATFAAALTEAGRAQRAGDATRRRACLERALDQCRGPLVPACYDDWIGPERAALARRCEEASADLVALLEEQREYAAAVARVRHWLEHDPVDEEAYRWLMRLLALAGDRPAALKAFRECGKALRRELDAEPSAATVAVHERIRRAESEAGRVPARAASPPLPLVGRGVEWARLREAWDRAAAGRPSFALVGGDAGIGKTRLAEELVTWARRQGVAAAATRCYAAEGRLSLAPVAAWLRSETLAPLLDRLEDVWLVELARILPELLARRPGLPAPAPMTDYGERLRFFEGLARAVLLAPPPLLLVIDDLQWSDRETLEWLHFLSRYDRGAALLVVGTLRPDEVDAAHPLTGLLRQLQGEGQLVELALEPLDAAETAKLAAEVAGRHFDAAASTRLYRETEGNPLFVVEAVRAEAAGPPAAGSAPQPPGPPPRVQAVIAGRLAQLSGGAREVAASAAVIGRAFDLEVLVRLVGDEAAVVRALDELWRKRIVREQGPNAYDFTHDRLRDVAYGETSAPQRRHLHRRVAEALLARHAADPDAVSVSVAAHYESAGLAERAIPHYARAAVLAQGLYAHEEAVALARRGLALVETLPAGPPRDRLELELRLVLVPSCRVTLGWAAPELEDVLVRALDLCERAGSPEERLQVLYGMQSLSIVAGRLERSVELAEEVVALSRETTGAVPVRGALAMAAGGRIHLGRLEEASAEIDRLLLDVDRGELERFHEAHGINYEIHGRAWQSHALWCLGRPDAALAQGASALARARELRQPFSQAIAATYLALLQQLRADHGTFRRQAAEALELSAAFRATYYRAWAAILVAYGDTLDAPGPAELARLRATIEAFTATGARLRLPYFLALLAEAHRRADDRAGGLAVVDEALIRSRETRERWWDAELHRLRGVLLSERGDAGGASLELQGALEIAREQRARSLELRAASTLARQWAAEGRRADARGLLVSIVEDFREGHDTPDLREAAAVLVESL